MRAAGPGSGGASKTRQGDKESGRQGETAPIAVSLSPGLLVSLSIYECGELLHEINHLHLRHRHRKRPQVVLPLVAVHRAEVQARRARRDFELLHRPGAGLAVADEERLLELKICVAGLI